MKQGATSESVGAQTEVLSWNGKLHDEWVPLYCLLDKGKIYTLLRSLASIIIDISHLFPPPKTT